MPLIISSSRFESIKIIFSFVAVSVGILELEINMPFLTPFSAIALLNFKTSAFVAGSSETKHLTAYFSPSFSAKRLIERIFSAYDIS